MTKNDEVREPAGTILAELGRRRTTVGRLAAATGMSQPRMKRRLDDPEKFELGELSLVATALSVPVRRLLEPWLEKAESGATPTKRDAA